MNAKSAAERILALVLSVALVLTTTPVTALTAYAQNSGACAHVCGDGTCTYTEGADCDHAHDESCGEDGVDCAHDCNDGTCGYIDAAPCNHEHDEDCGDQSPADGLLTTPDEPDKDEPDEPEPIENDAPSTLTDFVTVLGFSTPAETATVPLGTSYVDLPLPENLSATVGEETDPADVPVEWTDDDDFDGDTLGDYGFTGQLGAGYILAGGVNPPTFTVTVEADAAVTTQIIVARFDALDEDVEWQGYDFDTGTSPAALTLPDTLHGTDADDNPIAIMGVTWQSEPEFTPEISQWYYFSPTLPQGYALAESVKAPVISVFIRPEVGVTPTPRLSATQLTDTINNFAHGGTGTLSATQSGNTVTVTGTVAGVNKNLSLNIDSGVTVVWRANYSGDPTNYTLRVQGGGEFELAGGSIKRTGNNYALSSSVTNLTISGGTVSTSSIGAAIYINSGTLIMTGGAALWNQPILMLLLLLFVPLSRTERVPKHRVQIRLATAKGLS